MSRPNSSRLVSVVVVTAGRRQCLSRCLEALRRQTYRPLELIFVLGPTRDGSAALLEGLPDVKVCRVDRLCVTHARNAAVRRAGGDIIAFIDDDAVAPPRWLAEIVGAFEHEGPCCGGVGGPVVDGNDAGRRLQAFNNTINDLGEPTEFRLAPGAGDDPSGSEFNYYMGANMAFRREAILAAGGFDETYSYLYEDADICVGIIRAGYRLVHHARASVDHFPATSHNRRSAYDLNFFASARHQLYFALKHSRQSTWSCLWGVARTKADWLRQFALWVALGVVSPSAALRLTARAGLGLASGLRLGLCHRRYGSAPVLGHGLPQPAFLPITSPPTTPARLARRSSPSLRIALVCGEFGGPVFGGVGRYTQYLAEALSARGHDVTVLRSGQGPCRIEPEGYRVAAVPPGGDPVSYRGQFLQQLRRLETRGKFDLVEAPLWNGEGAALGAAGRWPLVVRLQTPYELTRQICGLDLDPARATMIAAERLQLAYASGVIGISHAVVETVERVYGIPLAAYGRRLEVIPLGLPSVVRPSRRPLTAPHAGGTRFLFVGRLEARKGVVELGRAFAQVAERDPRASLWIVGADNSRCDGFAAHQGRDYPTALREQLTPEINARIHFFGRITDAERDSLYAQSDVLVAPSRYESFGLVFLEAMRHGKPVIGTAVGGVPEVVADGATGLLVPPEAPERLAEAMLRLADDPGLRHALGAAGQLRFEESFSLYSLARRTEAFYRHVLEDWLGGSAPGLGGSRVAPAPAARPVLVRRVP